MKIIQPQQVFRHSCYRNQLFRCLEVSIVKYGVIIKAVELYGMTGDNTTHWISVRSEDLEAGAIEVVEEPT